MRNKITVISALVLSVLASQTTFANNNYPYDNAKFGVGSTRGTAQCTISGVDNATVLVSTDRVVADGFCLGASDAVANGKVAFNLTSSTSINNFNKYCFKIQKDKFDEGKLTAELTSGSGVITCKSSCDPDAIIYGNGSSC